MSGPLEAVLRRKDALQGGPFRRLARGRPVPDGVAAVEALRPQDLASPLRDAAAAAAAKSALFIAFDGFDEAHDLAQNTPTWLGNWCHAVLHRREPDAGNSGYWYRRVSPPTDAFERIGREAARLLAGQGRKGLEGLARRVAEGGRWRPLAFVQACQEHLERDAGGAEFEALLALQEIEWRVLLEEALAAARKA